jgi:hypothetical protein
MKFTRLALLLLAGATALVAGCSKPAPVTATAAAVPKHEHKPPHHGTPVVLGDEVYHVELVRDAAAGRLQAYVFDGELENFIRSGEHGLEIDAVVNGQPQMLVLAPVANPATGETVGDTALFEGQADWLKGTKEFDATLKTITIRGSTFADVKFNFPKGNDKD